MPETNTARPRRISIANGRRLSDPIVDTTKEIWICCKIAAGELPATRRYVRVGAGSAVVGGPARREGRLRRETIPSAFRGMPQALLCCGGSNSYNDGDKDEQCCPDRCCHIEERVSCDRALMHVQMCWKQMYGHSSLLYYTRIRNCRGRLKRTNVVLTWFASGVGRSPVVQSVEVPERFPNKIRRLPSSGCPDFLEPAQQSAERVLAAR